jgi:DNA polymerase-3 subunit delta
MAKAVTFDASMRIVVIHGDDAFLVPQRTAELAEKLEKAFGEIERFEFDGASADLAQILDELRSFGLMQQHKLVVLDQADQFLTKGNNRKSLERYADSPVEHATLLMRAGTWRPGNIDKRIAKVGMIMKIKPPTESQTLAWCAARATKRYDTQIDRDAVQLLVRRCGLELARLDHELAKLAAGAGDDHPIDRAQVQEMVAPSREEEAWSIQEAMVSGSAATALAALRDLIEVSRQPETLLMWAISDLLRKLHAAAQMLQAGQGEGAVSKRLRLWGPSQRPILSVARRQQPQQLARLLKSAIETDVRMKTGQVSPALALECLTVTTAQALA